MTIVQSMGGAWWPRSLGVVNTWWSCGENMLWSYGYLEIRWWYVAISSETVGVNFDLVDFFFFNVSQRIIFCYINLNENLSFVDNCIRGSNVRLINVVAYWSWAIDSSNIDTHSLVTCYFPLKSIMIKGKRNLWSVIATNCELPRLYNHLHILSTQTNICITCVYAVTIIWVICMLLELYLGLRNLCLNIIIPSQPFAKIWKKWNFHKENKIIQTICFRNITGD